MSVIDSLFGRMGYQRAATLTMPTLVEKATDEREGIAQNPLAQAYGVVNNQFGVRKSTGVTMQTLRRMARANWVDWACIFTLRDEITGIPWDIVPTDPHQPFNSDFQEFLRRLLSKPNRNNENWRTLIDKVVEDILVADAGCVEKVRDGKGRVVELYHVDGTTIKPMYDKHGVIGSPAYLQFVQNKVGAIDNKPVAAFENDDLIYIMWNPSGAIDTFGYGMSPVEAGLAVATAFLNAEAYNLQFFQANAIPPIVINLGKDVSNSDVEKFRSFLATEMLGQDGFHKPVVGSFAEGFDIKELMAKPTDMAWKEYVEWQMKWKVALYRMSPQDIGFTLDQYKTEGQVQQQLSKNKAINSLKGVLKEYIDTEIIGDEGYLSLAENLEFQWIDDETVDPKAQAEIDQIYLQSGVKSVNEVRRQAGLDPIAGGSKPFIVVGQNLVTIDPEPITEDQEESGDDDDRQVHKAFTPEEGRIVSLAGNSTAVAWMDDRGVTQPLFVTNFGKTLGFTVKPSFLDDRKEQEPPEAEVAGLLRLLKVNTPDVAILSYDAVLKLLPESLYPDWTNWISLKPPYNSQEWRDRWGDTRKSDYYIVTGFLDAKDLGNETLQAELRANPAAYRETVCDLARVWLAERRFYLGDRKPGHYLITRSGHGFGVDYQFYQDQRSWEKSNHYLPMTLKAIHPELLTCFIEAIKDEAATFGITQKSLPQPDDWERMQTLTDIEDRLARRVQKKINTWYTKAVHVVEGNRLLLRKANEFNPDEDYLVSGSGVYQHGTKYPLSVLPPEKQPGVSDLELSTSDYRDAYDLGVDQLRLEISTQFPNIKVRNPELYADAFTKRVNFLSQSVDDSLKGVVDDAIVKGIDEGKTYGEIGQQVASLLSVDPDHPDFAGWRAERIARTECLPGETLVDGAVIEAVYRRWYTGKMVEVTTRSGRKFSATPNHPMLTRRGWLFAGEITEGDDLVCNVGNQSLVSARDENVEAPPATLSEIFDSATAVGVIERRRGAKPDFHGDGMEGQVDVLRPHRTLRIGRFSPLYEPVFDDIFESTDMVRTPLCPKCARLLSIQKQPCRCTIPDRDLSVAQSLPNQSDAHTQITSDDLGRLASDVTSNDGGGIDIMSESRRPLPLAKVITSGASETPGNPGSSQDFPNSLGVVVESAGDVSNTMAGNIEFDDVVSVVIHDFDGYVYNLSTPYGYYTINGGEYTGNTMWAINEGMRQQYQAIGVTKVNLEPALTACAKCADLASGNPYTLAEAENLLPAHPNCRCVLTGDFSDLLAA